VFARADRPVLVRRLVRAVWHCGVVAWIAVGALLITTPTVAADGARRCIVVTAAAVFGSAAIGNALATRGRHFGWMVLAAVTVLALVGM